MEGQNLKAERAELEKQAKEKCGCNVNEECRKPIKHCELFQLYYRLQEERLSKIFGKPKTKNHQS